MSVICRTFVQNTWRSDLCSNCFKSLEDHADGNRRHSVCEKLATTRYVPQAPSLYQSRGISTSLKWRLNESLYDRVSRRDFAAQTLANNRINDQHHRPDPASEQDAYNRGILVKTNSAEKKYKSRGSVDFADEEAFVIGYGGNDYDSDTSPWEMGSDDGSIDLDLLNDTDEDRKISRMTKNNTEFNSSNRNLLTVDDRVKRQEDKLNTVNNNSNSVTPEKTNSDPQPGKKEGKKLNQYFFPSPTEALKSYLNRHGKDMIIDRDAVIKSNNELCQKIHNSHRTNENAKVFVVDDQLQKQNAKVFLDDDQLQKQNAKVFLDDDQLQKQNSKAYLEDDFSPLNTKTYSFVSELSKSNEQSSDSDYSTCRLTATGDSTDSESVHEDDSKVPAKKSSQPSFLHGSFAIVADGDKKFDAGSSTSGDVSNFSDDSDTHDFADHSSVEVTPTRSPSVPNQQQSGEQRIKSSRCCDKNKTVPEAARRSPPIAKHTALIEQTSGELQSANSDDQVAEPEDAAPDVISLTKCNEVTKSTCPKSSDTNYEKGKTRADDGKPTAKKPNNESSRKHTTLDSSDGQQTRPEDLTDDDRVFNRDSGYHSTGSAVLEDDAGVYEDLSDSDRSPEESRDRQSKLAALALELELARKDSERKQSAAKSCLKSRGASTKAPPSEMKTRFCLASATDPSPSDSNSSSYPTIKKPTSAVSCVGRLSSLPDVLPETTTAPPAKQKKSRFSLKKLLKRNKDSCTFSPSSDSGKGVTSNPKAWKKQAFERSRLSLEILHPMDLTSDVPTSADSTPTEEHRQSVSTLPGRSLFKGVSSRARSMSALPQLTGDDHSGVALLECRRMDNTLPARKAGTVAERKKTRPSLVRTPSCSALPNRTAPSSLHGSNPRVPPPKPPPPPKYKAMQPPPPPPPVTPHPRSSKPASNTPARPPPPKVPETKPRSHSGSSSSQELREPSNSDKEYANLGDIRSLLTPKKPQRPSAFSGSCRDDEMACHYETLPTTREEDEEDHYTYLDEAEVKSKRAADEKKQEPSQAKESCTTESSSTNICGRPWLDLQTSYAAIAAANYESLAELITTSHDEGSQYFKKIESSLKWKDFQLETDHQLQIIGDRVIYNAAWKEEPENKVTLVVTPKKHTAPQNVRNQTRHPVLASFVDAVPKNFGPNNYVLQDSETAAIYVVQQSSTTTVKDFAKTSAEDDTNQSTHLRNYCFVLLQLIHTLKSLQAEGIEDINYDLEILVLVVTDEDKPPILVLFPEDKVQLIASDFSVSRKTLCQATLETMLHFLQVHETDDLKECLVNGELLADPVAHTFRAIAKVLAEEKASSLSQAKGFLEYMLWGPVDVRGSQGGGDDEAMDTILQRWLDLQRAQMVKSTISQLQNSKRSSRAVFHVYEEYQLVFLLQASVKSLKNVVAKL